MQKHEKENKLVEISKPSSPRRAQTVEKKKPGDDDYQDIMPQLEKKTFDAKSEKMKDTKPTTMMKVDHVISWKAESNCSRRARDGTPMKEKPINRAKVGLDSPDKDRGLATLQSQIEERLGNRTR